MTRKVIRITESELQETIKDAVSSVITEIGYRSAALAHGANYNAQKDYDTNHNDAAKTKMGSSENITLPALSKAIQSEFSNIKLEFVEHNADTNRSYPVDLIYKSIKFIDKKRVVIMGDLIVSLKEFGTGTIEYNFETQEFYRVSYSDKTTRSRRLHKLQEHNIEEIHKFLVFISNYIYSTEDYEHNIDINEPTPSKRH